MNLRRMVFVLCVVCGWPAVCDAGLIQFQLTATNFWIEPGTTPSALGLQEILPPGSTYTFNTATNSPIVAPILEYNPQLLSPPAPKDLHPGGWATWNFEPNFGIDIHLVDVASGQSADFEIAGRLHAYNEYSQGSWSGIGYFWFMYGYASGSPATVTLGGNQYTVWSEDWYSTQPPSISVWVGSNPPVVTSPEPCTILLAGLGLLPVGLRAGRRRHASRTQ